MFDFISFPLCLQADCNGTFGLEVAMLNFLRLGYTTMLIVQLVNGPRQHSWNYVPTMSTSGDMLPTRWESANFNVYIWSGCTVFLIGQLDSFFKGFSNDILITCNISWCLRQTSYSGNGGSSGSTSVTTVMALLPLQPLLYCHYCHYCTAITATTVLTLLPLLPQLPLMPLMYCHYCHNCYSLDAVRCQLQQ